MVLDKGAITDRLRIHSWLRLYPWFVKTLLKEKAKVYLLPIMVRFYNKRGPLASQF